MRVDAISTPKKEVSSKRYVIHNVNILDASGSMAGGKYNNAIEGIRIELDELSKDTAVDYTVSLIEFHSSLPGNCYTHKFMAKIDELKNFKPKGTGGLTPLYQTIGETIDRLLKVVKEDDRVLIKIFTDGGENASHGKYASKKALFELIKKVQKDKGFTVTFVGTNIDVHTVITDLGIDRSNTLVHDNTERGIKMSFMASTSSTKKYSKSVAGGASASELSRGFYTKTVEQETK